MTLEPLKTRMGLVPLVALMSRVPLVAWVSLKALVHLVPLKALVDLESGPLGSQVLCFKSTGGAEAISHAVMSLVYKLD